MKVVQTDGSVLMQVADARIDSGRILVTGKIMGAMPMKALIQPGEVRSFLRELGLRRLLALGWLVLRGRD